MRRLGLIWKIVLIGGLAGIVCWVALATAVFIKEETTPEPGKADCIIVLGAKVRPEGDPSTALLRRLEKALECYEKGLAPAIIVCGAQGADEPCTEAEAMKKWLVEQGVPPEAVIEERESTSTEENLANAKAIMEEKGMRTCIVTTNAYHLTRAMWIAGDAGLDAQGAAALNNITLQTRVRLRMREAVSWVLYFLGI
ncbi:MAG: YdcF family protein [Clostridia bacterium]|nr:YdcF family protein [Clostridia bacterium]MBQ4085322.1 YdcF family protein [Clostridia bacterium]